MADYDFSGLRLRNLGAINIILGKNGCGKSTLLRTIQQHANQISRRWKYIPPERGGAMKYSASMEEALATNRTHHLQNERARNQKGDFRPQSAALFGEMISNFMQLVHDDSERRKDISYNFENIVLTKVNNLLDNIEIERVRGAQRYAIKGNSPDELNAESISSGESELFSLASELLSFHYEDERQDGLILFDEPDVHIHPDLQYRLAQLIVDLAENHSVRFIIATHSTALLSALSDSSGARVFFMRKNDMNITFENISSELRNVVPVFSPHPLSNQFNARPLLLVEGQDDELIWTQAVKSSNGRIKLLPCATGTISKMALYETITERLAVSIYDKPVFYSIRDKDDGNGRNTNLSIGKSCVLDCYSTENMLLSEDILANFGLDWQAMKSRLREWIEKNPNHQYVDQLKAFNDTGYDRKNFRVKSFRNILLGLVTADRPFYFVIGQAIGRLNQEDMKKVGVEGTLPNFLGREIMENVVLRAK